MTHTSHGMWRTSHMHAAWPFWPRRRLFFFLRSRLPAQNGYGGVWHALSCAQWITGARTGGEPSGAHWDHRAEARDTAGGPGRYTNTGHGAAVVACKSHSSNIVDVLIVLLTRPRPSSTTLATPSQTLLTASRCSSSLLRTGLHNSTGRNSRRRWMLRKPISWRLRRVSALTAVVDVAAFSSAEKQELVGAEQAGK